ncbi:MAG: DnaA/Hda family protein [Pseudomonadota bacterium]
MQSGDAPNAITDPDQLPLDIPVEPSFAEEDFVKADANLEARTLIQSLAWPTPIGLIVGEKGAGKTHLAHIAAASARNAAWVGVGEPLPPSPPSGRYDLVILDGMERWLPENEDAFFHVLEAAKTNQIPVLVTTERAPENLGLKRPDIASRLRAGIRAEITRPDDTLFTAITFKLFTDRQLLVDPSICAYLLDRIERSYANLSQLIAQIDSQALAKGRAITKPLAREVLDGYRPPGDEASG